MPHDPINSTEILPGKPVKAELFGKVKGNDDDHETRLAAVEIAVANFRPIEFAVHGMYAALGAPVYPFNLVERIPFDMKLLSCYLVVGKAGISGTLEVDFEYKRGAGAWTTLTTTHPTVAFGAGDNAVSINGVLDPLKVNLLAGDFVRIKQVAVQAAGLSYGAYLSWEPTI